MHAILSNLMAAWLVILAVTGCCCHPQGRAVRCCDVFAVAKVSSTCCENGANCAEEQKQSVPPCQQQDKCLGVCTYLPGKSIAIDTSHTHSPYGFLFLTSTNIDASFLIPLRLEFAVKLAESPPLLRPHLLHRILLI